MLLYLTTEFGHAIHQLLIDQHSTKNTRRRKEELTLHFDFIPSQPMSIATPLLSATP